MNSLSVKSRLWILVGIVLTALLIVSVAGVSGMQQGRTAVKELGWNRMPSIIGLNYMIRGQLDIKIQNRNALLLEYDPKIAEKAPKLIKARKEAVELILKGRGIYEALPPSPEEVAPWEELNSAWKEWFQGNVSMDGIITELGQSANDQVKIKELIGKYKAQIASNTPLAATTLNNSQKLLDINTRIGSKFYEEADAGMGYAQNAIYALSAAALLVVAGLATLIIRSIVIPLADMQSTMQSIERNNDFTLRLSVKGTDELSQVSNSFNKLVGKIHGSLEQILSGVREINAATGGLGTRTTVSRRLHELFPLWWLEEVFSRVHWGKNEFISTIDGICSPKATRYTASSLSLVAALLYERVEDAVTELMAPQRAPRRELGFNFWASSEMFEVYVAHRGGVSRIAEHFSVSPTTAKAGLMKQGLPGFGKSGTEMAAVHMFLQGMPFTQACERYDVSAERLEAILRIGGSRLKAALDEMLQSTWQELVEREGQHQAIG